MLGKYGIERDKLQCEKERRVGWRERGHTEREAWVEEREEEIWVSGWSIQKQF